MVVPAGSPTGEGGDYYNFVGDCLGVLLAELTSDVVGHTGGRSLVYARDESNLAPQIKEEWS